MESNRKGSDEHDENQISPSITMPFFLLISTKILGKHWIGCDEMHFERNAKESLQLSFGNQIVTNVAVSVEDYLLKVRLISHPSFAQNFAVLLLRKAESHDESDQIPT